MGLAGWIELIKGVLQFPDKILKIVRLFQKTPAEKHDEIMNRVAGEEKHFADTGRPVW